MNSPIKTRIAVSSLSALLALGSITFSPTALVAADPEDGCPTITVAIDANLTQLQSELADLNKQIADTQREITALDVRIAEQELKSKEYLGIVLEAMRNAHLAGLDQEVSLIEIVGSTDSLSQALGKASTSKTISDTFIAKVDQFLKAKDELSLVKEQAQKKLEGAQTLQAQSQQNVDTAQQQQAAKEAAAKMTHDQCVQALEADRAQKAQALLQQNDPEPTPAGGNSSAPSSPAPAPKPISGGNNPYPFGQCTWYVFSQTGRGQMGNAGTWKGSSSGGVGSILIMPAGVQSSGGVGHVGIVVGMSATGITIRDMNWSGVGVVTTHTVPRDPRYRFF